MASGKARSWMRRMRGPVGSALAGPQILAFLPAITLAGYWIGGEAALIAIALLMPGLYALAGLFGNRRRGRARDRDPVTDLPLRPEIVADADALLADGPTRTGTTAAVAVGIDEFADLIDRHGDAAGTAILRACADRLRASVRDTDLVARLDGPRFAVVLTSGARADLESLIQLATRIQKRMEGPVSLDGTRLFASVSVGFCAPKRSPVATGDSLVAAAEQALDDAVSNGTGAIRAFTRDMQRRAKARGALSEELPKALEEGQIRPWFQPQVCARTGAVTGFEALARWEHPTGGLVPPAEFLPAAEQLGLLERLGEIMLYQGLNALRAWDASGCRVPNLSLNFSAEELRNPAVVDRIRWELDRFDVAPERLTVEVLETVIAQTANDTIIRNLRAFAEMGCGIDLDDFGTGHASITNIKRFSVGRIKIDRSFVTRIDGDLEQQNIVSAILTLAERLELETLAEGVENAAEHAVLRRLGCGHVQGYAIARPMPFEAVEDWVRNHENRIRGATGGDGRRASPPPGKSAGEQGKTA